MSEEFIREHGRCCACWALMSASENINMVNLDKYATWDYPAWGNILARDRDKRKARRALAILCDSCMDADQRPKYAVEFVDHPNIPIRYHEIDELEDAAPITEEDLKEPR